MKKLFLTILLMIPIIIYSQTPVPPGPVSGTWDLASSPYIVNGDIYIEPGSTLTIEPGVKVRFTGWYKFIVDGALMAIGVEADSILFTADDTTNRWYGIRIIDNISTVVMDYCIIEYGITDMGQPNFPENAGGGICIYNSPLASITISNSLIQHNQAYYGGGIQCDNANPTFDNCKIVHNTCVGRGGGIQFWSNCQPVLTNSLLAYNYSYLQGGGLTCDMQCSLLMENNTIIHNSAEVEGGGIAIYMGGSLIAKNNVFAYNSARWGGGIAVKSVFLGNSLEFSDNTIVYNNVTQLGDGGGLYCYSNNTPSFESDIFYFNTKDGSPSPNQVHLEQDAVPSFEYCDIEYSYWGFSGIGGGVNFSGVYENCIDEDPLFADALNGDFSLSWSNYPQPDATRSQCIDAGWPGFLPEPDGTCNDIGALLFYQQLDVPIALDAMVISPTIFLAQWNSAYGALGYQLDVALDPDFEDIVYENIQIEDDTNYLIENATQPNYYYRVRSYNTALTSVNSNVIQVIIVSIPDFSNKLQVYSYSGQLHINASEKMSFPGQIRVYNASGKLIMQQFFNGQNNTIQLEASHQILIVKVLLNGKIYHRKLFAY